MPDSEAHLSLILKAKNLAGGEIGKTQKSLQNLKTGALSQLDIGFASAAGAAALLTGALIKGVQGAIEEEAQLKRVEEALKASVPAWNGDMTAVTKAVHAREQFGFTDSALRESMIKLVPATKDVTKALELQKTAMDLARLKGISLEDASQALVKVEGGQFKMLKSLGIALEDGATQTEALAAVQKVAMGQAAAYADTLAGKTEVLQARFDDLTENIGGLLIPALSELADTALLVVDVFDTDSPTTFADRLKNLTDVVNTLNPMTWGMNRAFEGTNEALDKAEKEGYEAARAMDTFGEQTAGNREPTKGLTKDLNKMTNALSLSGQEALDLVNAMIEIRREEQFLMKNGKPFRTSMRGRWGQAGAAPNASNNADGGWVGLNGPELSWLGERGPEYVVPNHQLGAMAGGGGVTIQGVTERELMDMVDRQMYFRLRRAGTAR